MAALVVVEVLLVERPADALHDAALASGLRRSWDGSPCRRPGPRCSAGSCTLPVSGSTSTSTMWVAKRAAGAVGHRRGPSRRSGRRSCRRSRRRPGASWARAVRRWRRRDARRRRCHSTASSGTLPELGGALAGIPSMTSARPRSRRHAGGEGDAAAAGDVGVAELSVSPICGATSCRVERRASRPPACTARRACRRCRA